MKANITSIGKNKIQENFFMDSTLSLINRKNLLFEEGIQFKDDYGKDTVALGTGIIPIVGTARSGKTSLAYAMLEWVIDNTKRDIILDSFPQKIIDEAFPKKFEGRIFNHAFIDIAKVDRSSVWLVDDTGASFNSRDSMSGNSRTLSKVAGILSHWVKINFVIFLYYSL